MLALRSIGVTGAAIIHITAKFQKNKPHWAAKGDGPWIRYDMDTAVTIAEVAIAWSKGNRYQAAFTIEASVDGTVWQEAFSGDSSGTTRKLESYTFDSLPARYVRVTGYGNSRDRWNRIAETEIYGQPILMPLSIQSVQANHTDASHPPAHTLDGDLDTHWSAEGDGPWIRYDAGATAMISEVAIAWLQGDRRTTSFTLEVSSDGNTWKEVFSGDSSGTTRDFETYAFPSVAARYVLIVEFGNDSDLWNEIAETEIRGHLADAGATEEKTIGKQTYTVQLAAQDDFANLDNWVVDMPRPEGATVNDNTLEWDTLKTFGTLWHKSKIHGPSIVEYDVQALEGKLNINGVFYASRMREGQETLLEARRDGDGNWKAYRKFPNYTMTYLDPEHDDVWRIRFRKNPGGKMIAQRHKKHGVPFF